MDMVFYIITSLQCDKIKIKNYKNNKRNLIALLIVQFTLSCYDLNLNEKNNEHKFNHLPLSTYGSFILFIFRFL